MSTATHARFAHRIAKRCESAGDARTLRLELLDEIRTVVGFDAYAWLLADPQTAVGCSPLADVPCLPELPRLIRLKYLTANNRWTALPDSAVARLVDATEGDRAQSMLWRDLLRRYDIGDVVSMVFKDRFGTWGFLDLWRAGLQSSFADDDAEFLATIAPIVTTALRQSQANTLLAPVSDGRERVGPVVLLLSAGLEVLAQTPQTEQHLRLLVPPAEQAAPIPSSAYNVGAQLLAVEAGVDSNAPFARMHLAGGVWVTARAARIGEVGPIEQRNIAITIEACSPGERLGVFGPAFGLTTREREILGRLASGSDNRGIAREMLVSQHTIQGHMKAIFVKTDSHNRQTLLAHALGA